MLFTQKLEETYLMHNVQKLHEKRREAWIRGRALNSSHTVSVWKSVTKSQPFLLEQSVKSINCSIKWIQAQLGQRCNLQWNKLFVILTLLCLKVSLSTSQPNSKFTCVVTSDPSSRHSMTDEPCTSTKSTTAPDNCIKWEICWSHSVPSMLQQKLFSVSPTVLLGRHARMSFLNDVRVWRTSVTSTGMYSIFECVSVFMPWKWAEI